MLIKIVMFEDLKDHADNIVCILNSWAKQNGHELQIRHYDNPMGTDENTLNQFDCILSDVKMPGQDGISFARDVRKINPSIPIIFISDYVEYGLSGYEVSALRFLNKNDPHFDRKLYECMDTAISIIECTPQKGYTIVNRGEHINLMFRDIMYIEARDHVLTFHTQDCNITERNSITALTEVLPDQFCQCTRSHIVNVQHIVRFSLDSIKLRCGDILPLTKTYSADLMKKYAKCH